MRKKVKLEIPKNQRLKLEDISQPQEEFESLEEYKEERINIKSSIPISSTYKKNTKTKKDIIVSISSIIAVLIFIIVTTFIIITIVKQIDINDESLQSKQEQKLSQKITGSWQSSYNGLFIFNKDNSFYWYNSYKNLKDNYYRGTYNYKTGTDALTEMGYTLEEFKKEFGTDIKIDNLYSINLKPNYVFMSGIDITSVDLNENETWWYLLIIKNDGTAFGYNKTLDLKYNLVKKAE